MDNLHSDDIFLFTESLSYSVTIINYCFTLSV